MGAMDRVLWWFLLCSLSLWRGCGATVWPVCSLSDARQKATGTTLLPAFLYLDHTSRIHLGTRHKKDPGLRHMSLV
jgi:hypothetical protein